jgi:hypothetical protein
LTANLDGCEDTSGDCAHLAEEVVAGEADTAQESHLNISSLVFLPVLWILIIISKNMQYCMVNIKSCNTALNGKHLKK